MEKRVTEANGAMAWFSEVLKPDAELTALATGGLWNSLVPQGTEKPYVVFFLQSCKELGDSAAGDLGAARALIMADVVTEGDSYAEGEAILGRIITLLHQNSGTAQGIIVQSCVFSQTIMRPEVDRGVRLNHMGGIFKLFLSREVT